MLSIRSESKQDDSRRRISTEIASPFITNSSVMRDLLDRLERIAHAHATVLVEG